MSKSLRLFDIEFDTVPYGERAILLRPSGPLHDTLVLPRIGETLMGAARSAIEDIVATNAELMLVGEPRRVLDEVTSVVASQHALGELRAKTYRLPVLFDDEADWSHVLAATKHSRDDYLDALAKTQCVLTMYGFIPGFLYLSGLPKSLRCTRKATPTTRCPAGSVAVGGPYLGIYGLESPAGWNVIGRTPVETARSHDLPPTPFRIGDVVQLEPIDSTRFDEIQREKPKIESFQIID